MQYKNWQVQMQQMTILTGQTHETRSLHHSSRGFLQTSQTQIYWTCCLHVSNHNSKNNDARWSKHWPKKPRPITTLQKFVGKFKNDLKLLNSGQFTKKVKISKLSLKAKTNDRRREIKITKIPDRLGKKQNR